MQWVATHRNLVRHLAKPYRRFMQAESNDLWQEATIAAFTALITARKKKKPEQFIRFFRVIFKTNCVELARGIPLTHAQDEHQIPNPDEHIEPAEHDFSRIEEALTRVSMRERQACLWLMCHPGPDCIQNLACEFKVSKRQAYRLLSRSLGKISGVSP